MIIPCFILLILLAACGGLHDANSIVAVDDITHQKIGIPLEVHNYADAGSFSNFTTPLSYDEIAEELRTREGIISVTDINHYLRLETESGEFYLKYNGRIDDEYRYSLFAEVGKINDFGENIYIPFHLLRDYPNEDSPATATPFEGDVYYNSNRYSVNDFADYYREKGIYTVEVISNVTLLMTDKTNGYSFVIEAFDDGEWSMLVFGEEHGEK